MYCNADPEAKVLGTRWFTQGVHMWQSRVEIEHYSVVYFNRIITFEML